MLIYIYDIIHTYIYIVTTLRNMLIMPGTDIVQTRLKILTDNKNYFSLDFLEVYLDCK